MENNFKPIEVATIGYPYKDLPNSRRSEEHIDQMARIYPDNKRTRTITFQVTDSCNLRCSYCYQINKGVKRMKFETAKKLIDYLLTATPEENTYINTDNTHGIIIDFIGGEPFLEVELMDQISDYFISQMILLNHPWKDSYIISTSSNGTLYFTDKVQKFIQKYKNKLSITITIDGNKKLHDSCRVFPDGSGSYDIAMKAAMDYFHNIRKDESSNTKLTVAPGNVEYLFEAIVNLIDHGYTNIHSNPVFEEGWTLEHAKIYYRQLKMIADYIIDNQLFSKITLSQFSTNKYLPMPESDDTNWCGGNGEMLAVDPDGKLFNCVRYMESSLGVDGPPPLQIGDVDTGIASNEAYRCSIDCMKCITRRSQSTEKCFYCPIARGCSWCSAYNYQVYGTPNKRATFICEMHQAESLANCYYYNKFAETQFQKGDIVYANNRLKLLCPYDWAIKIIDDDEYELLEKLSHSDRRRTKV